MVEAIFPPRPLSVEQASFIRQCVDVITTVVHLYGMDCTGFSLKGTYDHWIYCAAVVGSPMKFVKWKIASFYAHHMEQEVPASPCLVIDHPGVILSGRGYAYLRMLKNSQRKDFESLLTSILYSKKGMPRPGKDLLRVAEDEAFANLTGPVPVQPQFLSNWADVEATGSLEHLLSQSTVEQQIYRTTEELFSGEVLTDEERMEPFFPSTSANYINTRSMGGVVGHILDHPSLMEGLKTQDPLIQWKELGSRRSTAYAIDSSRLRLSFSILYKRMKALALTEVPLVTPLALAEALKTRVISKGPPLLNTVLKPLQHKMWSVLKKHPCFQLIGKPVTADIVGERMGAKLPTGNKYLSVDYVDATNKMFSWCSDAAIAGISTAMKQPGDEVILSTRSLTGHKIEHRGVVKEQTRGQLMGEITSFPILCVVNAAICRWAMELASNRKITLLDARLLVNGDDAVMRTNEAGRRLWTRIASFCGLEPSIGKVYWSERFLNINSTTYNYHPEGWEGYQIWRGTDRVNRIRHFELVPYINLGLLFNLKRSGDKAGLSQDKGSSIGARCTELIRLCPPSLREVVFKSFFHRSLDELKSVMIPWFVPEALGGLGLPTVGEFGPSDKDLRLARKIYEHSELFRIPSKPVDAPWRVWQYTQKRFPVVPTAGFASDFVHGLGDKHHPMTSAQQLFSLACVESLFRVNSLSELFSQRENSQFRNWLRTVSRVWHNALVDTKIPYPEPFNPDNYPKLYNSDVLNVFHTIQRPTNYF